MVGCPKLKTLNLNLNIYLTSKTIDTLVKYGSTLQLESLSLAYQTYLTDDHVENIINSIPTLQRLNLSGTSVCGFRVQSKTMRRIYMNDCSKCNEETVENVLIGCPLMQVVELYSSPLMNSNSLTRLLDKFPNVKLLY